MKQYETPTHCPNCGAELSDWWALADNFVGEWDNDRFRCEGHLKPENERFVNMSEHCSLNRTPSCGYFGLADLGIVYDE